MTAKFAQSLLPLLLLSSPAWGQSGSSPEKGSDAPNCSPLSLSAARLEARKLLDDAEQASGRRNKVRSLEAAYRLYQVPAILYNLGMLWQGAGKRTEAADLLRRYLYEADSAVSPERRDRLSRLIARAPKEAGELELSGEPCAFVYVDGRLVGRMPLPLPLLLRSGAHVIDVEKGHRKQRVPLTIGAGLRAHSVRLPSTAALLSSGAPEPIVTAAESAIAEAGLTPISAKAREAILASSPKLRGCLEALPCQEELARLLGAQYLLLLQLPPDRLALRLFDADAGAVSVEKEVSCPSCGPERLAQRALDLSMEVVREGLSRAKGTLQLTSVPEADVLIDGRRVGRTPLLRSALTGAHTIAVHAPGFFPHKARIEVEDGKRHVLDVSLKADRGPPQPPIVIVAQAAPTMVPISRPMREAAGPEAPPRPRWRLALGGTAAALGAGLVTFGALALSVNGQCGPIGTPTTPMPGAACDRVYQTLGPGGAMLGTGAALLIAGLLSAAWPAAAPEKAQRPPMEGRGGRLAALPEGELAPADR